MNKIDEIALRVADRMASPLSEDQAKEFSHALLAELSKEAEPAHFQSRVWPWMIACFGEEISNDKMERNHRFLEESLELVQATGCTQSEAHQLVDYVYGRATGEPYQEVGGVMVTLAALCLANGLDMHANGETELERIWTKVEKIRAKQAAKPKHSPLPEHPAPVIASEQKPVATMFVDGNIRTGKTEVDFSVEAEALDLPHGDYQVFTSPPNTAEIEQRVAEACRKAVLSEHIEAPTNKADDIAYDNAIDYAAAAIRKWREYL